MTTKSKNSNLHKANKAKNDEFYTQISDIEKELGHYKEHLKGKIVFCNCDDPEESHFWKYFSMNFEYLGLKKLISTHFERDTPSYKMEITRDVNEDGKINNLDAIKTPLKQNGDFRSPECIEILKECDIVVTNPPFSLFREYLSLLMEHDKKFVIVGSQNAITYKEVFCLIKENRLWLGYGFSGGNAFFKTPNYRDFAKGVYDEVTGLVKFRNIKWFTNIDTTKRHEELILWKAYKGNESDYPHYDNYDAINVDKVKDIPVDYEDAMGVPITFLDKYNPEQFEIVALGIIGSINFSCNKKMEILKNGLATGKFTFNAKGTLYRKHNPSLDKKVAAFKNTETGELYSSVYARIIIRRV